MPYCLWYLIPYLIDLKKLTCYECFKDIGINSHFSCISAKKGYIS